MIYSPRDANGSCHAAVQEVPALGFQGVYNDGYGYTIINPGGFDVDAGNLECVYIWAMQCSCLRQPNAEKTKKKTVRSNVMKPRSVVALRLGLPAPQDLLDSFLHPWTTAHSA